MSFIIIFYHFLFFINYVFIIHLILLFVFADQFLIILFLSDLLMHYAQVEISLLIY